MPNIPSEMDPLDTSTTLSLSSGTQVEFANDLWDRSNPRALINIVAPNIAAAIDAAYKKRPELFGLDEKELFQLLKKDNQQPSATDNRLRMRIWDGFDRAVGNKLDKSQTHPLQTKWVVQGVCSVTYFTTNYIFRPEKVAWLLTPPTDYITVCREALNFGIDQIRDLLEEPHRTPDGRVDHKMAAIKLRIVALLDMRIQGAPVQRQLSVIKDLREPHQTGKELLTDDVMPGTMEALQKRIKELDARDRKAEHVIDITPVEDQ